MYLPDSSSHEDAFRELSLTPETNQSPVIRSESDDADGCPSVGLGVKVREDLLTTVLTDTGKCIFTPNILQSDRFNYSSISVGQWPSSKVIPASKLGEGHER